MYITLLPALRVSSCCRGLRQSVQLIVLPRKLGVGHRVVNVPAKNPIYAIDLLHSPTVRVLTFVSYLSALEMDEENRRKQRGKQAKELLAALLRMYRFRFNQS